MSFFKQFRLSQNALTGEEPTFVEESLSSAVKAPWFPLSSCTVSS